MKKKLGRPKKTESMKEQTAYLKGYDRGMGDAVRMGVTIANVASLWFGVLRKIEPNVREITAADLGLSPQYELVVFGGIL